MKTAFTVVALLLATPVHADEGIASVYGGETRGKNYCGSLTSNGEHMNCASMTAAMLQLNGRPIRMGEMVNVTCLSSGRTVMVRINDHGPYVKGRIIDLTPTAAKKCGIDGLGRVRVNPVLPNHSWGQ